MSLANIKTKLQSQEGFTIVELLIVVVVIAILAAITIVSYNGITSRANQSSAESAAATVQKKVELYFAEVGNYPISYAALSSNASNSYYLPSNTYGSAAPSTTNGTTYVQLQACRSNASALATNNINGMQIIRQNFSTSNQTTIVIGSATCANPVNLNA